jgi:DNA relaxase NicK
MLSACIDWISASFKLDVHYKDDAESVDDRDSLKLLKDWIGLGACNWTHYDWGFQGYRKSWRYLGITINYDHSEILNAGFVLLTFTGEGCRTWEAETGMQVAELLRANWPEWKITRLDLAIDDISEDDDFYLDIPLILQHMDSRDPMFCSPLRRYLKQDGPDDCEARFGSRSSNTFIRIYDKRLERMYNTGECEHRHWIRCEVEFKDHKAEMMARRLLDADNDVQRDLSGILLDYLFFCTEPRSAFTERNMRRDGESPEWWSRFLQNASKLKLKPGPAPERNADTIRRWIMDQCPRNIVILKLIEGDELFSHIVGKGLPRLNQEDWNIIVEGRKLKEKRNGTIPQ